MLNHLSKSTFLLVVMVLGWIFPAFAEVNKVIEEAAKVYDDLAPDDSISTYKAKRDQDTARIREKILRENAYLKDANSDLAREILARKIKIEREREFLGKEMEKGTRDWYSRAVKKYNSQSPLNKEKEFAELEKYSPNYKDTRLYLDKIQATELAVKKVEFNKPSIIETAKPGSVIKQKDEALKRSANPIKSGDTK